MAQSEPISHVLVRKSVLARKAMAALPWRFVDALDAGSHDTRGGGPIWEGSDGLLMLASQVPSPDPLAGHLSIFFKRVAAEGQRARRQV